MNEQNEKTQNTPAINQVNQPQLIVPKEVTQAHSNLLTPEKKSSENSKTESTTETAKGIYDQAKNTAGQAYGVATKKATEVIEEKKGDLAGGLTSVAESIKQVGENLRETDSQNQITQTAAKYSDGLAQQIEKVSNYFENKDVREMVGDAERFARRNPALFVGAAFGIGFLAARFLKSSPVNTQSSYKLKVTSSRKNSGEPAANPS